MNLCPHIEGEGYTQRTCHAQVFCVVCLFPQAAIHRTTPHRVRPAIPILGTRSPSQDSVLFPACLRHMPIPIFGTYHTILIDIPSLVPYTRVYSPSWRGCSPQLLLRTLLMRHAPPVTSVPPLIQPYCPPAHSRFCLRPQLLTRLDPLP
jgi:hypothetical protein